MAFVDVRSKKKEGRRNRILFRFDPARDIIEIWAGGDFHTVDLNALRPEPPPAQKIEMGYALPEDTPEAREDALQTFGREYLADLPKLLETGRPYIVVWEGGSVRGGNVLSTFTPIIDYRLTFRPCE